MNLESDGVASTADGLDLGLPTAKPSSSILSWLQSRGISEEAATRLSIGSARHPGIGNSITFPYFIGERFVGVKYRNKEKAFSQDGNCVLTFFNSKCLLDESLAQEPLIITEGEIDAATLISCGYKRVVGFGAGAPPRISKWPVPDAEDRRYRALYTHHQELSKVEKIILLTDADEAGRFLNIDLRRRLGEHRCYQTVYHEDCKDINDVLTKHGPDAVRAVVSQSRPCPISNVKKLSDYADVQEPTTYSTGWPWLDKNLLLYRTEFAVITGHPSSGKSQWTNALICNLAKQYGFKTAITSLEMPPVPYFRDNLRRYLGDAFSMTVAESDQFIHDYITFIDPDDAIEEEPTLDWFLDRVNKVWLRESIDCFVIDPWNELTHNWQKAGYSTFTEYVGGAIKEIKAFVRKRDMIGFVVAHPTKMSERGKLIKPTLYDIEDSRYWYSKADHGVVIHRVDDNGAFDVCVQKSRNSSFAGRVGDAKFQLRFLPGFKSGAFLERYDPEEDGEPGYY